MSFVYRYKGSDQELTVRSDVRRYDLEEWACWEQVVEAEVKPAAEPEPEPAPAAVEVESVVEDKPDEAPKRRTRRKTAEVED